MAGLPLGIGATNPKTGAIQYDAKRIDGVKFIIPSGAGVTTAPVGSVVTLQEDPNGVQRIVLGAAVYTSGSGDTYSGDTFAILQVGFLEASEQSDAAVNQSAGVYQTGDLVAMITDITAVAAVPMTTNYNPSAGNAAYITPAGTLSSASGSNVAFPGTVWFGTPGVQNSGQLKTGYCFARLSAPMIGTV